MPASQGSQARRLKASVLALAELRLESEAGARTLKAEDFFVDIMTTAARPDEILTQVSFAPIPANAGYTYLKHRQPASGFAMVGVAALVTLDRRGNMDPCARRYHGTRSQGVSRQGGRECPSGQSAGC
jgi:carbon-monoxide dehydrogenase medium subunit